MQKQKTNRQYKLGRESYVGDQRTELTNVQYNEFMIREIR